MSFDPVVNLATLVESELPAVFDRFFVVKSRTVRSHDGVSTYNSLKPLNVLKDRETVLPRLYETFTEGTSSRPNNASCLPRKRSKGHVRRC